MNTYNNIILFFLGNVNVFSHFVSISDNIKAPFRHKNETEACFLTEKLFHDPRLHGLDEVQAEAVYDLHRGADIVTAVAPSNGGKDFVLHRLRVDAHAGYAAVFQRQQLLLGDGVGPSGLHSVFYHTGEVEFRI